MKRFYVLVPAALLIALISQPLAVASGPVREPNPLPSHIHLPAGVVCPFGVRVAFPVNEEVVASFFDDGGNLQQQIITGRLVVRLTNLKTDATLVENISGPSTYTFESADGFNGPFHWVSRGPAAQPFFPGDHPSSALLLFAGRATFHVDGAPDHSLTLLSHSGEVTDLCGLLAA
jgi:hypothetical protein